MKLSDICAGVALQKTIGSLDRELSMLSQDTREELSDGALYIAVKGTQSDGHDYIGQAIEQGAQAIVCQELPAELDSQVTYLVVEDSQAAVGQLASNFYGNPSSKIKVIGVTGTNGKTSVATSLYQALTYLGEKTALFSTVENIIAAEHLATEHTTGNPIEIHKNIAKAVGASCSYLCMEVSSHALDQHRVDALDFDIAIFTNLTQDHLDYHKTMEAYADAKKKFFDMLKEGRIALVNRDSEYAEHMVRDTKAKVIGYGTTVTDYQITKVNQGSEGQTFEVSSTPIAIKQLGNFNVLNMTAVYASLIELGFKQANVIESLLQVSGAKGRLEMIKGEGDIRAIVDYAHTPDALENVLETLNDIPHRKILTVFGCGGDRDRGKRALMAQVAERLSDIVVVTSDNPRTEDPKQIFEDIEQGFTKSSSGHAVIEDREEAIRRSIAIAKEGDIILVAGKGHEDYQIIGTEKRHFSDYEVLKKYLS